MSALNRIDLVALLFAGMLVQPVLVARADVSPPVLPATTPSMQANAPDDVTHALDMPSPPPAIAPAPPNSPSSLSGFAPVRGLNPGTPVVGVSGGPAPNLATPSVAGKKHPSVR